MSQSHVLRGRIGGLTRWVKEDASGRNQGTAPARQAFLARFDSEPNPETAKKLYFARLALKRSKKRRAA